MASCSRVARALRIALLGSAAFALLACVFPCSAHTAPLPPGGLDPREEITPEELASIPEPVPTAAGPSATPAKPAPKAAAEAPEPRSQGVAVGSSPGPPSTPTSPLEPDTNSTSRAEPATPVAGGPWIWRVQILATAEKALAERVAREAAERLGTISRVDRETPLYKVRLGGFGSEADAQILKARAVEMGYPGAFRVKILGAATDE